MVMGRRACMYGNGVGMGWDCVWVYWMCRTYGNGVGMGWGCVGVVVCVVW